MRAASLRVCRRLSDDQYGFMLNGFSLIGCEYGESIIQQGETGDHFYVVESGKYQATLAQQGNKVDTPASPFLTTTPLAIRRWNSLPLRSRRCSPSSSFPSILHPIRSPPSYPCSSRPPIPPHNSSGVCFFGRS